MANCASCGKKLGFFEKTVDHEGKFFCPTCFEPNKAEAEFKARHREEREIAIEAILLTTETAPNLNITNADKFQLHIYAALAEQEREFISLRTKQALAPLKGTGKLGGNRGNIDKANEAARALADSHAAKVALQPTFQIIEDGRCFCLPQRLKRHSSLKLV